MTNRNLKRKLELAIPRNRNIRKIKYNPIYRVDIYVVLNYNKKGFYLHNHFFFTINK